MRNILLYKTRYGNGEQPGREKRRRKEDLVNKVAAEVRLAANADELRWWCAKSASALAVKQVLITGREGNDERLKKA